MVGSILGTRVRRVEDPSLLQGRATYVDNIAPADALHCYFLRSNIASGRIVSIDTKAAKEVDGVVAVFTADDFDIAPFVQFFPLSEKLLRPILATGVVKYVGDPLCMIVANSRAIAVDASELIEVDIDPFDAVVEMEHAFDEGMHQIDENVPMNLIVGAASGNNEDPLAGSDVVARVRIENQRMAVAPMEPNSFAVIPNEALDGLTAYVSTQMPHGVKGRLASVFNLDKEKVRVITPNVGGGFGGKAGLIQEFVAVTAASLKLKRPLRWLEERGENILTMQGRGQTQFVELGMKNDGTIVGLRARMIGDAGAYGGFGGGLVAGSTKSMSQGVYHIPNILFKAAVASTNTAPTGALRGAGRPEATAFLERLIDLGAATLGMDPIEFRLKNLIGNGEFPYQSIMGPKYDSGDYQMVLDRVAKLANYQAWRDEQKKRIDERQTKVIGIGVSVYVEVTAGGGGEFGSVTILEDGGAEIKVGTSAHGQGHATTFSMLVADKLGIEMDKIRFVQSDTDLVPRGSGTGGSRSLQLGGSAVNQAAEKVLEIAKSLAANHLEASVEDVVVAPGGIMVAGSPASMIQWTELYSIANEAEQPLEFSGDFSQNGSTFPFGAHISIVEVDIETGEARPIVHYAVDDCGQIVNPMVVEGQQHGGIAQGVGQAFYEKVHYDEYGNPTNSSLAEYLVPSAAEMPDFIVENTETPSPLNPIGAKGIGESATVGSTPALQNAVVDALSFLGVRHVDMPMTPERVWQAINQGSSQTIWNEPPAIFETFKLNDGPQVDEVEI